MNIDYACLSKNIKKTQMSQNVAVLFPVLVLCESLWYQRGIMRVLAFGVGLAAPALLLWY